MPGGQRLDGVGHTRGIQTYIQRLDGVGHTRGIQTYIHARRPKGGWSRAHKGPEGGIEHTCQEAKGWTE
jgi:hypothetical protein